ncbi:hypothetical protein C0995_001823 [Termitomyces sp. Mi166|nr:hypothetical protein C0995_001823 [Termitomyces sp. Mi166\
MPSWTIDFGNPSGANWEAKARNIGGGRICIHRVRASGTNNNVFLPASFPPLETEAAEIPTGISLPPDDLEQSREVPDVFAGILADLDVAFPFQVSPHEKAIIEHPQSCYVLGRSGTGKTTTMLFKMLWIERTFQMNSDDVSKPRQIFVTKSRVLAGKVEEYFMKLLESLKVSSQSPENLQKLVLAKRNQVDDDNLIDLDDEDNWRSDLPKFSELQDSHFPLFLTFDRLCDLIEADFGASERGYSHKEDQEPRTFVSYELFENHYWPHFPQHLIKGLALVFSEIIGIIKGSENTTASDRGHLDRKTYEELSERTQSTFATQRSTIYSIFEAYQTQKRQQGDYDAADRYVDEAQDNLLIDALLLRSLCHNKDGLFWAGDTAQTISVGSAFRFDDLKAFLFRVEKHRTEESLHARNFVHRSQSAPKTFQLATNYRSHSGIVNCAQSVIELITRFWPYSIDTLAPEKGIVDGLKPVFLNGWDDDNVRYVTFAYAIPVQKLIQIYNSGSHIEFGAQQCILVRNESARLKLQEQVGNIGLIMTLYDSKGLEFNDVLLFNFFEDSGVELSQWRLLLTAAHPIELGNDTIPAVAAPQFNRIRHASICAEVFWTKRDLIHNCTPTTDMPRLAVSSSREEWVSKGKELFERKKYFQAKHCYERASMPREMAIANAYYLREEAWKIPSGDSRHLKEQRHRGFITAAEAFLGCAQGAGKNRTVYFRCAAECFALTTEKLRAAKMYLEAHEYDAAAKLFRRLGYFDEAVDVIKNYKQSMQSDTVQNIKEVARLFYFREERLEKARELFSTDEEELEYLEDLDLGVARAEVLVSLGRSAEAATLHLAEGRTQEAIPLFLKDSQSIHSMRQACLCILRGLWDNISMFKAIISYDKSNLAKLAHGFLETSNNSAAALCLYHYFRGFPQITAVTSEELAEILQLFLAYIRLLYDFAFKIDPRVVPSAQTLFSIRHTSLDDFFVPAGTFLYDTLKTRRQEALYSMDAVPAEMKIQKRQLYESFNPPFFYLGTQSLLDPEIIPEFKRGMQVVKEWLRGFAYVLNIYPQLHFLTNMFRISNMALTFDSRDAFKYLWRAPCLFSAVPPYLRPPHGQFMLVELLGSLDGSKDWKWSISAGFLAVCGEGADYLLYGSSDLATIPGVRSVFITRIIHKALTSINHSDRKFSHLYRRFVLARDWEDLFRALRNMSQGSLVDELVQLHDLGRAVVPSRPVYGVRIVPFKVNGDLFQLLGTSSHLAVETVRVDPESLQEDRGSPNATQAEDLNENGVDSVELDEPEGTHGEEIDGTAASGYDGFGGEPSPVIISADTPQAQPPSEDEQRAALAILKIYRRARLRRGHGAKARSTSSFTKIFVAYFEVSREISWNTNPKYRFVFLWPLPHLLVCLDAALAATSSQKKIAKKRLLEDHHENLDGISNTMNELAKLTKSLTQWQKMLGPTSDLHRRCDMAELRRTVKEATDRLQAPLFPAPEGFRQNLDIAIKGILTPRQPPETVSKPDLVVEEDFDELVDWD